MLSVADEKMSAANRMRYHSDLANSDMHHPETFIMKELGKMLENILINCDKLDILVTKEPAEGARRANVKVRVDQLKADVRCLQSSYASLQARRLHQEQEIRDRNSLLSMSFTTNAEAAKGSKGMINGGDISNSTSILIDRAISQNEALSRSNRTVDDMLSQGSSMLG